MKKQIIIGSRYHVIRKIGEGGMAKVYLAYDNDLEKNVALKVLRKENIQEKKIKHFKREANALSLMDDENIVKIYDVGEEGDIHYIVNEYVDGMTLKEYISTCSPLPIEEVIEITKQILRGLDHAHKRGVVHKDIKSQNILLTDKKNVKVTDFGIADIIDDDATKTQSVMGTPQYVAPEILNREELTKQSDIYSVGILMFEMLVGRAPFSGEKPAVIMIKQMNHPLPSVREERSDVPQSLENIIIKAAAKTLENRYLTAEDMLYDLETVLEAERINEKKLLLLNDFIDEETLDKKVPVVGDLGYDDLKETYNKENKSKKHRKFIYIGAGVFVGLIALIILISSLTASAEMPDLINKKEADATNELLLLNIPKENITVKYESSDTVAKDLVINTTPKAGISITAESKITLVVSSGEDKLKVDNYVGKLYTNVEQELKDTNMELNITYDEVDSDSEKGTIIEQSVEPGTELSKKDDINFTVSSGPKEVKMVNFYGLRETAVDDFEKENGVTIRRTYACSDVFPTKGTVFDQNPEVNTVIGSATQISVKVSNGQTCTQQSTTTETTQPPATTESTGN